MKPSPRKTLTRASCRAERGDHVGHHLIEGHHDHLGRIVEGIGRRALEVEEQHRERLGRPGDERVGLLRHAAAPDTAEDPGGIRVAIDDLQLLADLPDQMGAAAGFGQVQGREVFTRGQRPWLAGGTGQPRDLPLRAGPARPALGSG